MEKARIYHNPHCSKSRQSLALLQEKGLDIEIIDYQKTPPDSAALLAIQKMLGVPLRAMMRQKETLYKDLNLAEIEDEPTLLRTLIAHPILLERPIILYKNKAVIGRPPENIYHIL